MNKIYTLFIVFVALVQVLASESPYIGKIALAATSQTVQLYPLSQEPRIANIKGNLVELVVVEEKDSCNFYQSLERPTGDSPVLVVIDFNSIQRLSCVMFAKLKLIKQGGGQGLLIVTDNKDIITNHCKMYNDNRFFTGVMNSTNFNKIKQVQGNKIMGSLSIELKDSNLKLVEVWASSLNSASYDTQIALGNVMQKLSSLVQKVEWRPRIASLGCTQGDNPNICSQNDFVSSCACQGQFCSPQLHEKTASILIKEDLRQYLIFNQYPSKYMAYLQLFKQQCLANYQKTKYSQDCASSIMNSLEIDEYSINNALESFLDSCVTNEKAAESKIFTTLDKDKRAFVNYGRYPLLLLNKQIVTFKNQHDLQGQLCYKLQLKDQGCFEVSQTTTVTTSIVSPFFFIILTVVLVSLATVAVILYRRRLKRQMNKQLKMQVSTAVEHYFALSQASTRK